MKLKAGIKQAIIDITCLIDLFTLMMLESIKSNINLFIAMLLLILFNIIAYKVYNIRINTK